MTILVYNKSDRPKMVNTSGYEYTFNPRMSIYPDDHPDCDTISKIMSSLIAYKVLYKEPLYDNIYMCCTNRKEITPETELEIMKEWELDNIN